MPPYWKCFGCDIKLATACVDDMRLNHSGTVSPQCKLRSTMEFYDSDNCCPQFYTPYNDKGRPEPLDMIYTTAAYPAAFHCLTLLECEESTIYTDLLQECHSVCSGTDPRTGGDVCTGYLNAGFTTSLKGSLSSSYASQSLLIVLLTSCAIVFASVLM